MKICFLNSSLDSGGAERVISILANEFIAFHSVEIITWSPNESFYNLDKRIVHHKLNLTNEGGRINQIRFNLKRIYVLNATLRAIKPDVLISFNTSNNVIGILACKLNGIPIIISERGQLFASEIMPIWRKLRKMTYKMAHLQVLQTQEAYNQAKQYGLLAQKNVIIPNPLHLNEATLPIKENAILFVGRLSKEKRVEDLLKAFKFLLDNNVEYKLWIVGDGVERDNLMELAKDLNITQKVIFCGKQKNIDEYYGKAKIFVLPSISEGFPNVLLEAMNYKNIVISSNCSMGPKEIIENKVNGFLYEPMDVEQLKVILMEVIINYKNYEILKENAFKTLKGFSINSISARWLTEVENIKS